MNDDKYLFELPPAGIVPPSINFRERHPIWTECKARLIQKYLFYFVMVTKSGTYIDGFAGPQRSGKEEMWSAKLVLEHEPRWLRNFYLFELNQRKVKLLKRLVEQQPPRDKKKKEPTRRVEVFGGDFNAKIHDFLANNPIRDKEPTFCLLDQRTFECHWDTVQAVANHKKGGNKVELFYFFPEGWLNRSIKGIKRSRDLRMERWWGRSDWTELLKRRGAVRADFVCERFIQELGYKHVHPFAIYETKDGGKIMYYMIHASDHDAAPVLMNRAYGKALDITEAYEQPDLIRDLQCEMEAARPTR